MNRLLAINLSLLLVLITSLTVSADDRSETKENGAEEIKAPAFRFERRQFVVSRHRGIIRFDGVPVDRYAVANGDQRIDLIETFDGVSFEDDLDFRGWARRLRSSRTYTYDVAIRVNEDGAVTRQPLVLLPAAQKVVADREWETWLAKRSEAAELAEMAVSNVDRDRDLLSTLTHALSRSSSSEDRSRSLVADRVVADALDLWDVRLVPSTNGTHGIGHTAFNRGVFFQSPSYVDEISVQVIAADSALAVREAIHQHPGYRLASARKL